MKGLANRFVFGLAAVTFLAPLKFGVPVIVQGGFIPPGTVLEWLLPYSSWPNELCIILVFAGFIWLVLDRERMLARVDLLFVLPLLWLLTQALAVPRTICPQATVDTLTLFATGVLLFYVGAWYVRDGASAAWVFGGVGLAVMLVCIKAFQQYFTEFEETRQFAAAHLNLTDAPKDFLLRMTSNRPFAWFGGYPNALAGFLVVAFAPTLAWIHARGRGWNAAVRWLVLVFAGGVMIFCLVLTGSRGGVVAFGSMALVVFWCLAPKGGQRMAIVVVGLLVAVIGVLVLGQRAGSRRFSTSSLESRADYWRGAISIIKDHPWVGTGPGTFGSIYPKYKMALTEEAQAVHNNYLQMWSDSGVLAFVAFAGLWIVAVRDSFRLARQRTGDAAAVAICGALVGWSVHGLVDFDLYVPGVQLPVFILLGTVQGLKELPRTDSVSPRRRANWVVGAVCAVALAVVLWTESRALGANLHHGRAYEMAGVSPVAALDEARRAAALAPWNPRFQSGVGDFALRTGNTAEALAAYRHAVDDDPYRASLWWRLAMAKMSAQGIDAEPLQLLRKAVELNPTNARYHQALTDAEESVRQSVHGLLESSPAKETGFSN
jgi:O-antigen ligase